MRKILSVGILLLGSLVSVQAQAQTVMSAPVLENLGFSAAQAKEIVDAEQKIRDIKSLAVELEQLQIFAKNLKRASPKLWDSSLNVLENLSGATDSIGMYLNAGADFGGVLKRSGCLSGVVDAGPRPELTAYSRQTNYLSDAASNSPEQIIANQNRNRLRNKCRQLALTALNKESMTKQAEQSKVETTAFKNDETVGANAAADMLIKEMVETKAILMQSAEGQMTLAQERMEQEFAAAEQQRAMHERLMKSPSSNRQIRSRNPALTVDPRNY